MTKTIFLENYPGIYEFSPDEPIMDKPKKTKGKKNGRN